MIECQAFPDWLTGACLPLLSSFLSIGGYPISRGTRILVNMWAIHHDSDHWDKPDLFNPGKNTRETSDAHQHFQSYVP